MIGIKHACDLRRYIVCSASLKLPDYINLLRPEYAMYKLPWLQVPWWLIWFNTQVLKTNSFDYDLLYCTHSAPHLTLLAMSGKRNRGVLVSFFMDTCVLQYSEW